jgi:hypothetical protein
MELRTTKAGETPASKLWGRGFRPAISVVVAPGEYPDCRCFNGASMIQRVAESDEKHGAPAVEAAGSFLCS